MTKLKVYIDRAGRSSIKFNVQCLRGAEIRRISSQSEEQVQFALLTPRRDDRRTVAQPARDLEGDIHKSFGRKNRKHKDWITSDTWKLITERKNFKDQINQTQATEEKDELQARYWEKNREVKKEPETTI